MTVIAQPKRVDPKPRPVEGPVSQFSLECGNPEHYYVCVNLTDTRQGLSYYRAMGYEAVVYEEGNRGPHFKFGETGRKGEQVTYQDVVLMFCTKERKAEIERVGPWGGQGLEDTARVERLMTNRRAGRSVLGALGNVRGRDGEPLVSAVNETGPAVGQHNL